MQLPEGAYFHLLKSLRTLFAKVQTIINLP